ncbi:uncharacterized protein Gasu_24740 [Galdieria sulphuraria]|uniref:Uncharacterized protein n=1 Tax=Galdieria sulphuraria TaxID=130081 RepID=M2W316_GALSU|nr:uncharacterized protein Gasu_24740 [Galdieria sulphuraria]EME30091.1 hypothetical protein Gasu_24740 [Galdieria sulphuraria]|eukprot:XP_005706611.1 hypothetical protein Gasu_24740 [Galdieria sulphuraria]
MSYKSSSFTQQQNNNNGWQQEKENINPLPTGLMKMSPSHVEKKKWVYPSRRPLSDITELVVGPKMKENQTCSIENIDHQQPQKTKGKQKRLLSLR